MRRLLSLAAVIVAASLLLATSASARVLPAETSASLELGNHVSLFTFGDHADAISFRRGTITSYLTKAQIDRAGVAARFGRLGRIELGFSPSGHPRRERIGGPCRGGTQVSWKGVFTGTVELRGRYGFPSVKDLSFEKSGTLTQTPRLVCHGPRESQPPPPREGNGVQLWAAACDGRGFSVEGERPRASGGEPAPITYEAHARRRDGRVQIDQTVSTSAAAETFTFDEALTTATISPPAPFHGTGTVVRAADGSTELSGTLSARILGRRVALAGPEFTSSLTSFTKTPGVAYGVIYAVSCPNGKTSEGETTFANILHRAHLGALLPSGAR